MEKILKFGRPDLDCPHCVGPKAIAAAGLTRKEITESYAAAAEANLRREGARTNIHRLSKKGLKGKKHQAEIEEALGHQATIEQINHGGWPIEVQAWAIVCPDCDSVTQLRAIPSANFKFTRHGPVAEASSCADCIEAKQKAARDAEHARRTKLSNEDLAEEDFQRVLAERIITHELVEEEIAKAEAAGGVTPADSARILRLLNRVGQKFGPS